jgi:hypothetical protein
MPCSIQEKGFSQPIVTSEEVETFAKSERQLSSRANVLEFEMMKHLLPSLEVRAGL